MSALAGIEELARLRDALKPLCESFVADGYTMTVAGVDKGRLKVVIEAGEGACEECLVPKEVLSGIVLNSLPPESGVAAIDLIYPRDCFSRATRTEQEQQAMSVTAPTITPSAYAAIVERYLDDGQADGNVVIPPTEARLAAMIEASGRPAQAALGSFPGGSSVSVRDVAECALLAGCKPEYMPVVLTVFEIMLAPEFPVGLFYEDTGSYFPFVIVNGPARSQLGINCRPNVFGPGWRANATIGRALRLGLVRLAGATPGEGDRSAMGSAYKYTCVVGEDEEGSPWEPLHTLAGFRPQDSAVTVLAAWQPRQVTHQLSVEPDKLLRAFAEEFSTVTQFNPVDAALRGLAPKALLVIAADHRGYFSDAGWDRKRMQSFLHEVTRRRVGDVRTAGYRSDERLRGAADDRLVPLYGGPDDFVIVSAGSGGGRSMIGGALYAATHPLRLPSSSVSATPQATSAPESLDDYVALVDRMMDQGASEGWPILLPEREGVSELIAASGQLGNEVLGVSPWREGPITVADVAVNARMAGCRPRYMPLLIELCRLLFTEANQTGLTAGASTAGYHPWVIVHGPVARKLGLNHGAGLFGPGHSANAILGRTLRLAIINLAGYKPNVVDRSCLGTAYKYGCVIAEDEKASPWGPLHSDFGFQPGESAISLLWTAHARLTLNDEATSPEEMLRAVAEDFFTVQNFDSPAARGPQDNDMHEGQSSWADLMANYEGLVVLGGRSQALLKQAGWSKADVQRFLFEHSFRSVADIRLKGYATSPRLRSDQPDSDRVPVYLAPEKMLLMAAGGKGGASMVVRVLRRWHSGILD